MAQVTVTAQSYVWMCVECGVFHRAMSVGAMSVGFLRLAASDHLWHQHHRAFSPFDETLLIELRDIAPKIEPPLRVPWPW